MTQDEVCGNDTKTYVTECHMRVRACEERSPLTVFKKGPCGKCGMKCNVIMALILVTSLIFHALILQSEI